MQDARRIEGDGMLSILLRWSFIFLFVVQIFDGAKWNDASSHTIEGDAERQMSIFASHGILVDNMRIVEKESFNPPENRS